MTRPDPMDYLGWSTHVRRHTPPNADIGWEMPRPGSWMESGACIGTDPELFDPKPGSDGRMYGPVGRASVRQAKSVCRSCPVIAECLEFGLKQAGGIWGGTTEDERAVIRAVRGGRSARHAPASPEMIARIDAFLDAGLTADEVAAEVGCHRRTVLRHRRERRTA